MHVIQGESLSKITNTVTPVLTELT